MNCSSLKQGTAIVSCGLFTTVLYRLVIMILSDKDVESERVSSIKKLSSDKALVENPHNG